MFRDKKSTTRSSVWPPLTGLKHINGLNITHSRECGPELTKCWPSARYKQNTVEAETWSVHPVAPGLTLRSNLTQLKKTDDCDCDRLLASNKRTPLSPVIESALYRCRPASNRCIEPVVKCIFLPCVVSLYYVVRDESTEPHPAVVSTVASSWWETGHAYRQAGGKWACRANKQECRENVQQQQQDCQRRAVTA